MIAIDAPVLVQLLTDGPQADAAEACLRQCLGNGKVVVSDVALAELCASLRNGAEALSALEEMVCTSTRWRPSRRCAPARCSDARASAAAARGRSPISWSAPTRCCSATA